MRGLLQRLLDARVDVVLSRRTLLARAVLLVVPDVTTGLVFPAHPLSLGPMPKAGTGIDEWDDFSHTTYYSGGINPFTVVKNPAGSGLVIRDVNTLSYPTTSEAKHTTAGTNDDEHAGDTLYFASAFLWLSKAEFTQKGWVLVEQQQQTGSPTQAWSIDKLRGQWFEQTRDGTTGTKKFWLDLVKYGHWATHLVGQHIAAKPAGWTEFAMAHDRWPDPSKLLRRSGIATDQGTPGRNTVGIYAEHGFSGSNIGYIGPAGRGSTAAEAIAKAKIGAANMGFAELAA